MAAGEGRLVGSRSYRTLEILEIEPKVMGWERDIRPNTGREDGKMTFLLRTIFL